MAQSMSKCPHCKGELDLFELLNEEMKKRKEACDHMNVIPSPVCLSCIECEDCGLRMPPDEGECRVH